MEDDLIAVVTGAKADGSYLELSDLQGLYFFSGQS